jgi:hypothetical protein
MPRGIIVKSYNVRREKEAFKKFQRGMKQTTYKKNKDSEGQ